MLEQLKLQGREGVSCWVGHERFVGALAFVVVDGLAAVAPVDVAEDVQFGFDAPEFGEEAWAA